MGQKAADGSDLGPVYSFNANIANDSSDADAIAAAQRAAQATYDRTGISTIWHGPHGTGGIIQQSSYSPTSSSTSSGADSSETGSNGLGSDFSNTLSSLGITGGLPGLQQQQLGIYKDRANFDYGLQSSAAAQSFGYQSQASAQQYGQNLGLQQDQEKANQSLSDSQQQFQNQRQQMSQDFQTQTQNTQNNYNLGIMAANRAAAGNAFNLNFGGN